MSTAPPAALCSDGEIPLDEALNNIGFMLSNLGGEVSGLAGQHTREVAFLRAKNSWLTTELRELQVRQKRRSGNQQNTLHDDLPKSVPGEEVVPDLRDLVLPALRKTADAEPGRPCCKTSDAEPSRAPLYECAAPTNVLCGCGPRTVFETDEQITLRPKSEVVLQATLRDELQRYTPDASRADGSESGMEQNNICIQPFLGSKDLDYATYDGGELSDASFSARKGSFRRNSETSQSQSETGWEAVDADDGDTGEGSMNASQKAAVKKARFEEGPMYEQESMDGVQSLHNLQIQVETVMSPDLPHFTVCKELIYHASERTTHSAQLLSMDDGKTTSMDNSPTGTKFENCEQFGLPENRQQCRCIMSPVSHYRLIWELSGIVILLYDMVMIPMQAFKIPDVGFIEWMGWITLYYWTADLLFTFVVGYYSPEGKLIMDFKQIALRYLKTWFTLDVLIIGVDWFSILANLFTTGQYALESDESSNRENMSVIRIGKVLRILRLARLLRVMKLARSNFFLMVQEKLASETFFVMSNLLKNVSVLLMVSHFCACSWYAVGCMKVDGYGNWVAVYEMQTYSWLFSYLTSVHWALAQFANGEVLIEPQNIYERTMCVLVLMASLVIFSSFVAIVGNTVQQLIQRGAHLRSQQWMMRLYLRQNGISLDLKLRVNRYVGVITDSTNNRISQKDVHLIELLSQPLQIELQTEVFSKHLIMHPFFSILSKRSFSVMRNLCCNAVQQVLLSRGDQLFSPGEELHQMYFITVGELQYLPSNKVLGVEPMFTLQKEEFFCEAVLWTERWLSCGTIRAGTESELTGVNGEKFREVTTQYHTANMLLPKEYSAAWVEGLNCSLQDHGISALSDVQTELLQSPEVQTVLDKYYVKRSRSEKKKLKRAITKRFHAIDKRS